MLPLIKFNSSALPWSTRPSGNLFSLSSPPERPPFCSLCSSFAGLPAGPLLALPSTPVSQSPFLHPPQHLGLSIPLPPAKISSEPLSIYKMVVYFYMNLTHYVSLPLEIKYHESRLLDLYSLVSP